MRRTTGSSSTSGPETWSSQRTSRWPRARSIGARGCSDPTAGEFTEDSIGGVLASRDLNAHLRETGVMAGGPPPMADRDRSRFLSKLDELVQRGLRESGSS